MSLCFSLFCIFLCGRIEPTNLNSTLLTLFNPFSFSVLFFRSTFILISAFDGKTRDIVDPAIEKRKYENKMLENEKDKFFEHIYIEIMK